MVRSVTTVRVDSTFREVHALFARSQVDVLPVVGRDQTGWLRQFVGVVTRADLVRTLFAARSDRALASLRSRTAGDVLRRVAPLKTSDSLGAATKRLLEEGLAALPVVERDGRMAGMLSLGDVLAQRPRRTPLASAN